MSTDEKCFKCDGSLQDQRFSTGECDPLTCTTVFARESVNMITSTWKHAVFKPRVVEWREVIPNSQEGSQAIESVNTSIGKIYAYPNRDIVLKGFDGHLIVLTREDFLTIYDVVEVSPVVGDIEASEAVIADGDTENIPLVDENAVADASDVPEELNDIDSVS
jgi:hypothetical protein